MNGASETRGLIMQNIVDRLRDVERFGCAAGKVREEKVINIEKTMDDMKKAIESINIKMFWGMIIFVVIAIMAGINVAGMLHIIPK